VPMAGTPQLIVPVGGGDHILGAADARCTLVEYGDFECPYCGRAHPILRQLMREFKGDLRLVFRHFPLFDIHPRSENAAEAAEAAGGQGKFWEMHDLLFLNQRSLEYDDLVGLAGVLSLDQARFETDLIGRCYVSAVRQSRDSGAQGGVSRTPTFFIDGAFIGGAHELPALRDAVRQALL
jgi:protein-disulfide isomerase